MENPAETTPRGWQVAEVREWHLTSMSYQYLVQLGRRTASAPCSSSELGKQ
jgi:hypothetical protein